MKHRVKITFTEGEKIASVKIFRDMFSSGLKEAKDTVEALQDGAYIDLTIEQIVKLGEVLATELNRRWEYRSRTVVSMTPPQVPFYISLADKPKVVDPFSGRII